MPEQPRAPRTDPVSVLGLAAAFVFWPLGLPLSLVGLRRTRGGRWDGRGLAVGGVVVSVVAALLWGGLLTVAVVRGEVAQQARDLPGAPTSAPVGRTDATLLPDIPVEDLLDDVDAIRRQRELMEDYDAIGVPAPVRVLEPDVAERVTDLREQLRPVTCDALADAVLTVPPDGSTAGVRPREVTGARPVQDTRDTFWPPAGDVVVAVLVCEGTAAWSDGSTGGIRVELLADADARVELGYRRLG